MLRRGHRLGHSSGVIFRRVDRLFCRYRETGDPKFLQRVFDRTAPELLRVALYLTRDRHRAEDVLQTTFLTAMEKAASYDANRPLLPWLLTLLANHAREMHRRERRALPMGTATAASVPTTVGDVADATATNELAHTCDQALGALPEPYRPVLILHLRHGLSAQEIAITLTRPDSTVRNQIARGLDLLRRKLPTGLVGAVVLSALPGRGLAAVRRAVLAQAPAPTVGVVALAVAGVGLAGGLLMLKNVVVGLVVLAVVGLGVWTSGWFASTGEPPAMPKPGDAALVSSVGGTPSPAVDLTSPRQAVPTAGLGQVTNEGSLQAIVVVETTGTPVAAAVCSLWVTANGRSPRYVAEGQTTTTGGLAFATLPPGSYRLVVEPVGHQEEFTVAAGAATTLRIEIARGFRCSGTVVDRDGRPVVGAEVRRACDWFSVVLAHTGADGAFQFENVRDNCQVWAVHRGWQPSKRVTLDASHKDVIGVRLVLANPGTRLSGRVVDERGELVAAARVYVAFDQCIGSTEIAQFERHDVRTDGAGSFAIDWARPGRVLVAAVPDDGDLDRASSRAIELVDGEPGLVSLRFGDGVVVTGVVRDEAGLAVVGASVDASSNLRGLEPLDRRFAPVGDDGSFAMRGLLADKHWLSAQRAHGRGSRVDTSVELQPQQRFVWNPVLGEGAPIALRVIGPDDAPISHRALSIAVGGSIKDYGHTDDDGRHRFEHLPPVEHELTVYGADYGVVLAKQVVIPGAETVVIRIDASRMPSARISGRVVDATGKPVPDARVTLHSNGGSGFISPQRLDREARFQSDLLPPGTYWLGGAAYAQGLGNTGVGVTLVAKQEHDVGDLVLLATASLAVRLRGPGGEVVRDAMLRLGQTGEVWSSPEYITPDEVDGVYRLTGIDPGSAYVLRLLGPDVAPQNIPLALAAGERRELDVVAVRAVPVVFEIRCALVHPQGSGNLNAQLDVFDAAGQRVAGVRLSPYFDDFEQRLERLRIALLPGRYRITAAEAGAKKTELMIDVPTTAPAMPFLVDLR